MGELDVQLTVDAGRPMLVLAGELDVTRPRTRRGMKVARSSVVRM